MKAYVAAAVILLAGAVDAADDWAWPSPQVFAASYGGYALRTIPAAPSKTVPGPAPFGVSQAVLFKPGNEGKDVAIWKRELVNVPHRAMITDDGKYVVTFDTWGRVGYEHSLVIYGERGKLVADHPLDALLSRAEITERVQHSVSSRWWLREATTSFNERNDELIITLKWGKVLRVALATGTVTGAPA